MIGEEKGNLQAKNFFMFWRTKNDHIRLTARLPLPLTAPSIAETTGLQIAPTIVGKGPEDKSMFRFALLTIVLALATGCSSQPQSADVKDATEKSLKDAGFKDVTVSQDRSKGVVTIGGHVDSQEDKARAEAIAKASAGGQIVADEIGVQPAPTAKIAKEVSADQDAAISKNLDAAFKSAGLTGVKHKTKNGVVILTGKVAAAATRTQAELAASQITNVQQVVNEIQTTQN
jgi:osmotically-inducible protein OsmY